MSSDTAEDGEHPIDAHYKKLKTQRRGVKKGSELWQRLDTYLQHTHVHAPCTASSSSTCWR
jgi:hypothetical protein